jgi:hypothetical protein
MMLGSRAGANSVCSDWTLGAGGTTPAFNAGVVRDLSAETLGAGGTTESRVSPLRERSRVILNGAGAITFAGSLGGVSEECRPSAGGGLGIDL